MSKSGSPEERLARSNNNLAGATRDASISQAMTAAAIACDSLTPGKDKEVVSVEKVGSEVKCIPAFSI
jgi:hypothetical protein